MLRQGRTDFQISTISTVARYGWRNCEQSARPSATLFGPFRIAEQTIQHASADTRDPHDQPKPAKLGVGDTYVVICVHLNTLNRTMSTTMTVRLDDDVKDRLDGLAEATQRSKSFLAAEAIRVYVENNEWQIGEIRAAVNEADTGDFASDKDVAALAKKWKVNAR